MPSSDVSAKELRRRDFILNGSLWKVVIFLTMPLFFYSLLQYLYSFIDTLMSAQIGPSAITAVSSISAITNMITTLGSGLASGGSILIAREIGKKDYSRAKTLSNSVFTMVFVMVIFINVVFIPFADPIMLLLGVPSSVISMGRGYFILNIVNSSLVMVNTVFIGAEKAKGSTTMIMVFNIVVIAVKVTMTSLFIYVIQLKDVTYIALATFISNATLTLIVVFGFLLRRSYIFSYSFRHADLSKKTARKITFISFPIFLGNFIFFFGKVIVNSMARLYGDDVIGALGVSNSMGGMVTNGLSAVSDSTSAIISQNIGNGNIRRALGAFYRGLAFNIVVSAIGVILVTVFNDQIVSLYAKGDQAYAEMISDIFFFEKMGIITLGINSAVLGLLYGFGYTRISMVINIMRVFLFRIPSLYVMEHFFYGFGWRSVGVAMGFSNISIGITALIAAFFVIRHIKIKEREKEEARMLTAADKSKLENLFRSYLSDFTYYKKDIKWDYEDGVVMKGALDMYKATKDGFYLDFVSNHFARVIDEKGRIADYDPNERNIDNIQEGTALYYFNSIRPERRYGEALSELEGQLSIQNRTPSGSFWHKDRYPNQIWLDGLYMCMPFYALLACGEHSFGKKRDIIRQFGNVERFNYDPKAQAYFHCYDETKTMQWADRQTGRSPNVWLRSVGWLAMAEADVYDIFRSDSSRLSALMLKRRLRKTLLTLAPYADAGTGLYYDLPLLGQTEGNYLETSGSAMIAYAYLKGGRIGMLGHGQIVTGASMLKSIADLFVSDGKLNNICKVSGLDGGRRDGSVGYYLSEPVVSNDAKGIGPLMMAYAEYLRAVK